MRVCKNLALVFFLFSSCSTNARLLPETQGLQISQKVAIENVPFVKQDDYQCGPAALSMALQWSKPGRKINYNDLIAKTYTPGKKGSLQNDLISATRRYGALAYIIDPDLETLLLEVNAGYPVIILQNRGLSWFPVWHYAVVTGYDLGDQKIRLRSGRQANEKFSFAVFKNTWKRANNWGLLVLPPSKLPATASKERLLEADIGLEKSQKWYAVEAAYKSYLKKWPESLEAHIGLSNALHKQSKTQSAVNTLENALILYPNSEIVLNNLALYLFDLKQYNKAAELAEQAVAKNGKFKEICLQTLSQIRTETRK